MTDQSNAVDAPGPDKTPPPEGGGAAGVGRVPDIVQLIEAHHRAVYRYAFRLSGSAADAEDLSQQTFLIAHQKLDQIRDPQRADRWLFAVLRSCFLKNRRRRRPTSAANLDLDMDAVAVEMPVDDTVDRELLELALNELPEQYRLILAMFYFDEFSYKEIAQELDVPIGTVMSRLARAKGRLRQQIASRQASHRRQ